MGLGRHGTSAKEFRLKANSRATMARARAVVVQESRLCQRHAIDEENAPEEQTKSNNPKAGAEIRMMKEVEIADGILLKPRLWMEIGCQF